MLYVFARIKSMYLRTCGSVKSANHKKDWVRKSATCRICGRSANLTNYLSSQICGFADVRTAHFCLFCINVSSHDSSCMDSARGLSHSRTALWSSLVLIWQFILHFACLLCKVQWFCLHQKETYSWTFMANCQNTFWFVRLVCIYLLFHVKKEIVKKLIFLLLERWRYTGLLRLL